MHDLTNPNYELQKNRIGGGVEVFFHAGRAKKMLLNYQLLAQEAYS